MPLFDFYCPTCHKTEEHLVALTAPPPRCHGQPMLKQFSTPAFTFKNGQGTDGGNTWRLPGRAVPSG